MSDTEPNTALHRRIALLTLVMVVGIAVASTAGTAAEASTPAETIELNENVSVWVEATYAMDLKHPEQTGEIESPLVAEMPTREISATVSDGTSIAGETNDPAATAVDDDSLLQFEFWSKQGAHTEQFAGENVSLVAAKLDAPDDPAVDGAAELSPERAAELLVAEDRNSRATFDTHFTADGPKEMRVIDEDGYVASYYGLDANSDESGVYAIYIVKTVAGEGVTTEGGDIQINGEIDVLGVETAAVGDGESTVDTEATHERGETVEFEVSQTGGDVDHTIGLFNESAVADEQLTYSSDGAVDGSLSPAEVTVEKSAAVNGVAAVGDAEIYGAAVTDGQASQTSDVGVLASYLAAADTDSDGPAGSITARTEVDNGTISVETLDSWPTGEYTYFHVATADDGTTTSTSGTVTLEANETNTDTDDPSSDDPSSDDPPSDDPSSDNPPSDDSSSDDSSSSYNSMQMTTSETDGSTRLSVEHAVENNEVDAALDVETRGTELTGMRFEVVDSTGAFELELQPVDPESTNTTGLDADMLSALAVETESLSADAHGPITVQFTVDDDRLASVGAEESDVRLYQHTDGWTEHETEPLGEGRYEATVPQLSMMGIGTIHDAEEVLTVSSAELTPTTVQANESVDVTATVENPTAEEVGAEIELRVDGELEETLIETVPAGGSQEVAFEYTPSEPGNYTVSVAGESAGTLEVINEETTTEVPGFGIIVAVGSLLAVVLGARQLTRQ